MEPWIPRLRAELGNSASDEDILLHAFYDKELLAPLKKPAPAYSFRTSPLHEFIRYLGTGSDIRHARLRFAGTELTISS